MRIRSIRHKGLRRLVEDDDVRGLGHDRVGRVRNILAALMVADDMAGVRGPPGWRIHPLTGDRAGTWGIAASGNWRVTFRLVGGEIADLDLEDCH